MRVVFLMRVCVLCFCLFVCLWLLWVSAVLFVSGACIVLCVSVLVCLVLCLWLCLRCVRLFVVEVCVLIDMSV